MCASIEKGWHFLRMCHLSSEFQLLHERYLLTLDTTAKWNLLNVCARHFLCLTFHRVNHFKNMRWMLKHTTVTITHDCFSIDCWINNANVNKMQPIRAADFFLSSSAEKASPKIEHLNSIYSCDSMKFNWYFVFGLFICVCRRHKSAESENWFIKQYIVEIAFAQRIQF